MAVVQDAEKVIHNGHVESEGKFVAIGSEKVIRDVHDIVASNKDFVVEYQDISAFNQNYEMHSKVLGVGAFAQVKKATKIANGEIRAVKIIDKL